MEPTRLHRLPQDQISMDELRTGYRYIDQCLAKTYPDWKTKTSWSPMLSKKEGLTEIAKRHFHISNERFDGDG